MNLRIIFNRIFLNQHEGFLDRFLLFPLELLSYLYCIIICFKNFLFDHKLVKPYKTKSKVISIGNLTVGGTGKTPLVISLARYLSEKGYTVGIVTRSYKAGSKENFCLYEGNMSYDPSRYGDEPVLIKKKLGAIPVMAGRNKTELAEELEKIFAPEFIIIDDGFSHRGIERNLDILTVDGDNGFGNSYLLPRGPLREPLFSISRADAIVLKTTGGVNEFNTFRDKIKANIPIFYGKIKINSIRHVLNDSELTDGSQRKFIAFSGIGNPLSFIQLLMINNLKPLKFIEFEDHTIYDIKKINQIVNSALTVNAEVAICTEKDAIKLKTILEQMHDIKLGFFYVSIDFELDKNFYEFIEKKTGAINE